VNPTSPTLLPPVPAKTAPLPWHQHVLVWIVALALLPLLEQLINQVSERAEQKSKLRVIQGGRQQPASSPPSELPKT
jgi:hypothetical protein